MMKQFLKAAASLACVAALSCKQPKNDCPPVSANYDSTCRCIDKNDYSTGSPDAAAIYTADIHIDKLDVKQEINGKDTNYVATILVKNINDDNARNAMLIVTLPVETNVPAGGIILGPNCKSYEQCGAVIKVCLGDLNVCDTSRICKFLPEDLCQRLVRITFPKITNAHYRNDETLSAFVYSSAPDLCPGNNFKMWFLHPLSCNNCHGQTSFPEPVE